MIYGSSVGDLRLAPLGYSCSCNLQSWAETRTAKGKQNPGQIKLRTVRQSCRTEAKTIVSVEGSLILLLFVNVQPRSVK